MTPTLASPDPVLFSEEVRRSAAERGATDYLTPIYELTRRCFPGADIIVVQENDYEIADLDWIVFEVDVHDWDFDRYRTAKTHWITELVRSVPPDARQPFVLGMR
jgi:hypothetical protein